MFNSNTLVHVSIIIGLLVLLIITIFIIHKTKNENVFLILVAVLGAIIMTVLLNGKLWMTQKFMTTALNNKTTEYHSDLGEVPLIYERYQAYKNDFGQLNNDYTCEYSYTDKCVLLRSSEGVTLAKYYDNAVIWSEGINNETKQRVNSWVYAINLTFKGGAEYVLNPAPTK